MTAATARARCRRPLPVLPLLPALVLVCLVCIATVPAVQSASLTTFNSWLGKSFTSFQPTQRLLAGAASFVYQEEDSPNATDVIFVSGGYGYNPFDNQDCILNDTWLYYDSLQVRAMLFRQCMCDVAGAV